jgi:dUTP pyrophosphatase
MNVKIRKLHPDAVVPTYAKPGDSGFDLVATADVIIEPGETALVPTGLAFEIPDGYELQIRPRSGVTLKTKLRVGNSPGTVDSSYRGEVKVIVDNIAERTYFVEDGVNEYGETYVTNREAFDRILHHIDGTEEIRFDEAYPRKTYIIRKGTRIAQGVIAPVIRARFEVTDELSETERGDGGFGSTGTKTEVYG